MNQEFKAFYFNTEIILIDDNEHFLSALNYKLADKYRLKLFSNPYEALEYIIFKSQNNLITDASHFIKEAAADEISDEDNFCIDFYKMNDLKNDSRKDEIISVVLIDYAMPMLNGVDFCKKIAHLPLLKVMLTGHADFSLAINAFNEKIIDRFLVKDSKNMLNNIVESIQLMQNQFFEKQSIPLSSCLSANQNTLVHSKDYHCHFKDVLNRLNAVEYYILDAVGSYLLISAQGISYYFKVLSNKQLDELIDIANNSNIAPDLLNKIRNKTHAPIFIQDEDYKIPTSDWDSLLQPIQQMNQYFFCLTNKSLVLSHSGRA